MTAGTPPTPSRHFRPSVELVRVILKEQPRGTRLHAITADDLLASPWGRLTVELGQRMRHSVADCGYRWIRCGRGEERLAARLPTGTWRWRDPDLRRHLACALNLPVEGSLSVLMHIAQEIWADAQVEAWTGQWGRLEGREDGLWLLPGRQVALKNFKPRD